MNRYPRGISRFIPVLLAAPCLLSRLPSAMAQSASASDSSAWLQLDNLDSSCSPCRDLYRFANGRWFAHAEIPSDHPMWGAWFELSERTDSALRRIVERAMSDTSAAPSTDRRKLGTFYGSCLDSSRIDQEGLQPLRSRLGTIDAVRTRAALGGLIARLQAEGVSVPFGFWGGEDPRNHDMVIANAGQGGLGLPDRDYYTNTDARSRAIRAAYLDHVVRMLVLAREPEAQARHGARHVLALETALARASMTNVEERDPDSTYHKLRVSEVQAITPHFDWKGFLAIVGVPAVSEINVEQPEFFRALDRELERAPLDTWKTYLKWHLIRTAAPALSSVFVDEDFRFHRNFTGAKEPMPRWRRCLAEVKYGVLSQALGREYVEDYFPAATRARAQEMVEALRMALRDRIRGLGWMSESTKREALAKLATIRTRVGYPEKWWDYSSLVIEPGPYASQFLAAERWQTIRNLGKIGQPVDRAEWVAPPHLVDAFARSNEIVIPAGILQPPFFDARADDALNYGGVGTIIGHELTHHFDDQGRKFDAAGNLRDWWTSQDAANYRGRARRIIRQFATYTVLDSATHVNGELTKGENISDLGGLEIAYDALLRSLAKKGSSRRIDGFTPEQRFFLSYAQQWREISRPEYVRARVQTDPHAPWKWRVNGPVADMPEFARAFGCAVGDSMVRPDSLRSQIW